MYKRLLGSESLAWFNDTGGDETFPSSRQISDLKGRMGDWATSVGRGSYSGGGIQSPVGEERDDKQRCKEKIGRTSTGDILIFGRFHGNWDWYGCSWCCCLFPLSCSCRVVWCHIVRFCPQGRTPRRSTLAEVEVEGSEMVRLDLCAGGER